MYCLEGGYTTSTCVKCDYTKKHLYTEPTGHHYSNGVCVYCAEEEPYSGIEINIAWYEENLNSKEYILTTREELAGLAYLVNNGVSNFSGKKITLGKHIDLAYAEWVPIGTSSKPFAGTFDGCNLSIYHLKISEQREYVGLFGYVSGTITNFSVENANINVVGSGNYVGIACGYSKNGIEKITVSGYVDAENNLYVGGVVGYLGGSAEYCESSATVVGKQYVGGVVGYINVESSYGYSDLINTGTVTGEDYTAGIIGYLMFERGAGSSCTIDLTFCENEGEVNGKDYTAGIVGYIYTNNSYSSYYARINGSDLCNSGNITGNWYVGGLFGYAFTEVESTIQLSGVSGVISGKAYVGGIAGCLKNVTVDNCSNEGATITVNGYAIVDQVNVAYLGGFVGYGYGVKNCENTAEIKYSSNGAYVGGIAGYLSDSATGCTNSAAVSGADYVGGIAGYVGGNVQDCENSVSVTGKQYVGGIAGYVEARYTYAYSDLTNTGAVSGENYTAGVIGYLECKSSESINYVINLQFCVNEGAVNGKDYTAGVIGYILVTNPQSSRNAKFLAVDFSNGGNVTGGNIVGGLFGYALSEDAATVTGSANTGVITATGTFGEIIASANNVTFD